MSGKASCAYISFDSALKYQYLRGSLVHSQPSLGLKPSRPQPYIHACYPHKQEWGFFDLAAGKTDVALMLMENPTIHGGCVRCRCFSSLTVRPNALPLVVLSAFAPCAIPVAYATRTPISWRGRTTFCCGWGWSAVSAADGRALARSSHSRLRSCPSSWQVPLEPRAVLCREAFGRRRAGRRF